MLEILHKIKQHYPDFEIIEDNYLERDKVIFTGEIGKLVEECMSKFRTPEEYSKMYLGTFTPDKTLYDAFKHYYERIEGQSSKFAGQEYHYLIDWAKTLGYTKSEINRVRDEVLREIE